MREGTTADVMELLNVSRSTVDRLRARGIILATVIGGRVRYDLDEIGRQRDAGELAYDQPGMESES